MQEASGTLSGMATRGSTSERILDAALDLFATEGVGGTTITEIERRSGLQPGSGSLYRHFRSKDDVVAALITREVEALKTSMAEERAALPALGDPRSQLVLELHLALRHVARVEPILRVLRETTGDDRQVDEVVARVFDYDTTRGGWPSEDGGGSLDVLVAVAALTGYHQLRQRHEEPFLGVDEGTFVDRLADLLLAA